MKSKCSVCDWPINLEDDTYISGYFGILPVAFCMECYVSIEDMVHQQTPCPHCEKYADHEDEEEVVGK